MASILEAPGANAEYDKAAQQGRLHEFLSLRRSACFM
jgi:hypothetical protein